MTVQTSKSERWWACGSYVHDGSEGMVEPDDIIEYVRHLELCVSVRSDAAPHLAERVYALENALFECAKHSGADISDGRPTWPDITVWAVDCVKALSADYDEALDEIGT